MPLLPPLLATLPVLLLCVFTIRRERVVAPGGRLAGLGRLGYGAGKLFMLAPPLERLVSGAVRALPEAQSLPLAWMSTFAFAIQLYLTLSGVADLWVGGRQVFGRGAVEVFGAPFRSVGFGAFWRAWSLPLARAPKGAAVAAAPSAFRHAVLSLGLVLLSVALWRGLSWGTAVWVTVHLGLLAGEYWRGRSLFAPLPAPVCGVLTQVVVLISGIWLFMPGLEEGWDHARRLIASPRPSWYSVLLDARLSTPLPMWCLWLGGLVCVAAPPAGWLLRQAPRLFGLTGFLIGVVAMFSVIRHAPVPPQGSWLALLRHSVQWPLAVALREGSDEVFVGHEQWLCRQSDLDRLTFRTKSGDGAARLLRFAGPLREKGVPFLVVTVPDKTSLYPEYILPREYPAPVHPPGFQPALEQLRGAGIEVLDTSNLLWEAQKKMPVYFSLDSHWTPEAMKQVALAIAKLVRSRWPGVVVNETPMIDVRIIDRSDAGDLSRVLDPWAPASLAGEEVAQLVSIRGLDPVADSPVLILGGSLIRVFDDPGLSFGDPDGRRQSASLAIQLAALLGRPLALGGPVESMDQETLGQTAVTASARRLVIAVVRTGDL